MGGLKDLNQPDTGHSRLKTAVHAEHSQLRILTLLQGLTENHFICFSITMDGNTGIDPNFFCLLIPKFPRHGKGLISQMKGPKSTLGKINRTGIPAALVGPEPIVDGENLGRADS